MFGGFLDAKIKIHMQKIPSARRERKMAFLQRFRLSLRAPSLCLGQLPASLFLAKVNIFLSIRILRPALHTT